MSAKHLQIGKLLLEKGLISEEQLDKAIIYQTITGKKLGTVLVELGFIEEERLLQLLSEQLELPIIDLKNYPINVTEAARIPEGIARRNQCVFLKDQEEFCWIGMVDPQDLLAHDEIEMVLKKPIHIAIVREVDLSTVFNKIYG